MTAPGLLRRILARALLRLARMLDTPEAEATTRAARLRARFPDAPEVWIAAIAALGEPVEGPLPAARLPRRDTAPALPHPPPSVTDLPVPGLPFPDRPLSDVPLPDLPAAGQSVPGAQGPDLSPPARHAPPRPAAVQPPAVGPLSHLPLPRDGARSGLGPDALTPPGPALSGPLAPHPARPAPSRLAFDRSPAAPSPPAPAVAPSPSARPARHPARPAFSHNPAPVPPNPTQVQAVPRDVPPSPPPVPVAQEPPALRPAVRLPLPGSVRQDRLPVPVGPPAPDRPPPRVHQGWPAPQAPVARQVHPLAEAPVPEDSAPPLAPVPPRPWPARLATRPVFHPPQTPTDPVPPVVAGREPRPPSAGFGPDLPAQGRGAVALQPLPIRLAAATDAAAAWVALPASDLPAPDRHRAPPRYRDRVAALPIPDRSSWPALDTRPDTASGPADPAPRPAWPALPPPLAPAVPQPPGRRADLLPDQEARGWSA